MSNEKKDNSLVFGIEARANNRQIRRAADSSIKTALESISRMRKETRIRANEAMLSGEAGVDYRLNKELSKIPSTDGRIDIDPSLSKEFLERLALINPNYGKNLNMADISNIVKGNAENSFAKSLDKENLKNIKDTLALYRQVLPDSEKFRVSTNYINTELNKQLKLLSQVAESGNIARSESVASNVQELAYIKESIAAEKQLAKESSKKKEDAKEPFNLENFKQTLLLYQQLLPETESLRVSMSHVNSELNKQLKLLNQASEAGDESLSDLASKNVQELSSIKMSIAAEQQLAKESSKKKEDAKEPFNLENFKQTLLLYQQLLPETESLRVSMSHVNSELNKQLKLLNQASEAGDESLSDLASKNVQELSSIKMSIAAEQQRLKEIEKLRKETKKQGEELTENEKLLKEFNENFNVTGIVGIRAFRTIARYSKSLLKSLIDLTIETQKLENGFSSLDNKVSTFNSRITDIKKNLGSSITSVLEPVLDILNTGIGYISSLTRGLAELPFPLKQALGLFTLLVIVLPSVISLIMILRYYSGRIIVTFLKQAAATSKVAAFMVNYRAVIASTLTYISLFVVLALSVYNLFKKTNKESEKAKKNLGPSSFDDVNALTKNTAGEVEDVTEKTEKLYKVISAIIAALSIGVLLVRIFGKSFGFAGFEAIKSLFQVFTNPALLASVAAIGAVILGVAHVIQKLISGVKKLVTGWGELSFLEKSVSIFLMVASAVWTLAGAIIAVKGALKGNWLQFGLGALVVGGGIGLGYGANAYIDSKLPAMAHGGVVSSPTVAMVGEGKYNEAVVPLGNSPEFSAMKEDITNAVLAGLSVQGSRSNQPINITVNVDKDYIYKSYNQVAKQNGR